MSDVEFRRLAVRYIAAQILFTAIAFLLFFLRLLGATPRTQIVDIYDIALWSSVVVSCAFLVLVRKAEVKEAGR